MEVLGRAYKTWVPDWRLGSLFRAPSESPLPANAKIDNVPELEPRPRAVGSQLLGRHAPADKPTELYCSGPPSARRKRSLHPCLRSWNGCNNRPEALWLVPHARHYAVARRHALRRTDGDSLQRMWYQLQARCRRQRRRRYRSPPPCRGNGPRSAINSEGFEACSQGGAAGKHLRRSRLAHVTCFCPSQSLSARGCH